MNKLIENLAVVLGAVVTAIAIGAALNMPPLNVGALGAGLYWLNCK